MIINWHNIRSHGGSQELGFEELCSQLFHNEPLVGSTCFERRGYRDAGLECAHILRDGSLHGLQAKFFDRSPMASEWTQIDTSVKTAIKKNPSLKRLVICIPQNFDDPKIAGQTSAMNQWKEHVTKWEEIAVSNEMSIKFDFWGDTQLTERLIRPENRGKLWYFFEKDVLTPEWFNRRIEGVAKDAGARYTEELNLQLPIAKLFDGIGRTTPFARKLRIPFRKLQWQIERIRTKEFDGRAQESVSQVSALGAELCEIIRSAHVEGTTQLPLDDIKRMARVVCETSRHACTTLQQLDAETERSKKAVWEASGKPGKFFSYTSLYSDSTRIFREIASAADELGMFAESDEAMLANKPLLLVSGDAGTGKTHLFVDIAKRRGEQGLPTIVILGETIQNRDPMSQIMEHVGLDRNRDEFLQAIEAAAEASGGRALIMLDALNEGEGIELWPKRLAGLLQILSYHPYIGVALSVRSTYEETVIPENVLSSAVRIVHSGFASVPEKAVRAFFAHYQINLPRTPQLNPEYANPLFLKMLCKGLHTDGLHDLPEGYDGISRVFMYVVDATNRALQRQGKINTAPYQNVVREFLGQLANAITASGGSSLLVEQADQLSRKIYSTNGYQGSILQLLLAESLVAKELLPQKGSLPRESITFAYQRFGDHEIARRLLDLHTDSDTSESLIVLGHTIGQLFPDGFSFYKREGLLEALAIQVPERLGIELPTLLHIESDDHRAVIYNHVLPQCFIHSLAWRDRDAFTDDTFTTLANIMTSQQVEDLYIGTLLTLAPVPGHPLNAKWLHHILSVLSLPERDTIWTTWLHDKQNDDSPVDRLIEWALRGEDKSHLSDDSVHLASIALAWLCTSTNRRTRDGATRALVRVLTPRPHLIIGLLDDFSNVDDWYVQERLYAMTYGVALRIHKKSALRQLAMTVFKRLFASRKPPEHVLVRDYGRCVIDHAAAAGCDLPFSLADARPPYGSALPSDPPSEEEFKAMLPLNSGWSDRDRVLAHVIDRFDDFDFSRYSGGPSFEDVQISQIEIDKVLPLSHRQAVRQWEQKLTEKQRNLWERARELQYVGWQHNLTVYTNEELDELNTLVARLRAEKAQSIDEEPVATPYENAVTALEATLSNEQIDLLRTVVLISPSTGGHSLPCLSSSLLARWVSQAALELGWTLDRFEQIDTRMERMRSYGNYDKTMESMGVKYLWMGYYTVLARVLDNFQIFTQYDETEVAPFSGSWQLGMRSIDPSCIPENVEEDRDGIPRSPKWSSPIMYDIDDIPQSSDEWLDATDDLPNIAQQMTIKDSNGVEWIILETHPEFRESKDEDGFRESYRLLWLHLRGCLVKQTEAQRLFSWMCSQDFIGQWMPEAGHAANGVFLGEHYNSLVWRYFAYEEDDWQYQDWRMPRHGIGVFVAPVAHNFATDEDDTNKIGAILPSPILFREGCLQWNGEIAEWEDRNGKVVVQDAGAASGERSVLLIERNFLDRFLAENDYALVWTVFGEKQVIRDTPVNGLLEISGAMLYGKVEIASKIKTRRRRR